MKHVLHIEYDDETGHMEFSLPQSSMIALGLIGRAQLAIGQMLVPAAEKKSDIVVPQIKVPHLVK